MSQVIQGFEGNSNTAANVDLVRIYIQNAIDFLNHKVTKLRYNMLVKRASKDISVSDIFQDLFGDLAVNVINNIGEDLGVLHLSIWETVVDEGDPMLTYDSFTYFLETLLKNGELLEEYIKSLYDVQCPDINSSSVSSVGYEQSCYTFGTNVKHLVHVRGNNYNELMDAKIAAFSHILVELSKQPQLKEVYARISELLRRDDDTIGILKDVMEVIKDAYVALSEVTDKLYDYPSLGSHLSELNLARPFIFSINNLIQDVEACNLNPDLQEEVHQDLANLLEVLAYPLGSIFRVINHAIIKDYTLYVTLG